MTQPKRAAIGRIGAHALHAQGKTNTEPARAAADKRFYDSVDPDGVLDEAEREKRAKHARSLHFTQLARKRWAKRAK
jgi:hypothetical protein